jgi:hypothetical protein
MKAVPWWFQTLSSVLAVALSIWAGLHYRSPDWLLIYAVGAIVLAALPAHRTIGIFGAAVGLILTALGAYRLRDAWGAFHVWDVWTFGGHLVSATREIVMIVVMAAWLILGAVFTALRS